MTMVINQRCGQTIIRAPRGGGGGVMDRCITILSEKSFEFVMIE